MPVCYWNENEIFRDSVGPSPSDLKHPSVSLLASSVSTLEHKTSHQCLEGLAVQIRNVSCQHDHKTGSRERAQAHNTRMHMSCLYFAVSHKQTAVSSLVLISTGNLSRHECRPVALTTAHAGR